jgi:hypothetical protein
MALTCARLSVANTARSGLGFSAGAPRLPLQKSIAQPFDLPVDVFNLRRNSQVSESDRRFRMPLSFCRKLSHRSLKSMPQLREI